MYHAHFGLERGLFGEGIAADGAVFRSGKHDRLIAHFKLALASPSAAIVLHGPAGVGKTTLTATALRASSTRLALAWLNGMPTNAAELLELLLVELGINTQRTTRIERLQLWRQFQAEMRATDSRLFIVAEGAEDLSPEVLHALDQLTAPDAAGNPGANLVLLGHAGLGEYLANPLLDSLRQRVRLRAELEPLTEAELQDYLRHQVACAGGHYDRIFAPGTVAALFRYSKGIVRLANTLCESALDIAAVQQHKQLTPELVSRTAVSLLGIAEPAATARPAVTVARVEPAVSLETRPALRPAAPLTPPAPAPVASPSVVPPTVAAPSVVASSVTAPTAAAPTAAVARASVAERLPDPPVAPAPATSIAATPVAFSPPPSAPPAPAPAAAAPAPMKPVEEYDGGSTDVADVAVAEFPVLTDAVELPGPASPPKHGAPAIAKTAAPAVPARSAASPPTAAQPAVKPANRAEPAYTPAARPAAPAAPATPAAAAAPTPAPPARAAAPKPAAPAAPADIEDDDALRQTQTMRAIASAKSLDEISEADAETLFGDAELDLVSAALASAAEWPDDDDLAPAPTPAAAQRELPKTAAKPEPPKAEPKAAPAADDPFDLFGLGEDAPLELMDDSTLPPASPARRTAIR